MEEKLGAIAQHGRNLASLESAPRTSILNLYRMMTSIEEKAPALTELCRRFGVRKLELFGSAATGEFNPNRSDFDFIVEFPPEYDFGPWMSRWQDFQEELSTLFERPVDLVRESALRNPWFRREANKTRRVMYDASKDSEVAARRS